LPLGRRYVVRRVLFALATLFVVALLSYLLAYHLYQMLKLIMSFPEHEVQYFHWNEPVVQGFFGWLSEVLQGNFGRNNPGATVVSAVSPWILPTIILQIPAVVASLLLGLLLGVFAASRRGSFLDRAISATSVGTFGVPTYWLSILAIVVFSLELHWLPSFGEYSSYPPYWWGSFSLDLVAHYLLPFSVLVAVSTPLYIRVARATATDVLSKEWVTALSLSAIGRRSLIYKHVLRNTAGPALSLFGYNVAVFIAASPGIEWVFTWPGLGLRFVKAALAFDQSLMLAIVMIMAVITVLASFAVDLVQAALDPRVSLA
jgi:peptide/nickel transport system permease protein